MYLRLALNYMRYHPFLTAILILCLSSIIVFPVSSGKISSFLENRIAARAADFPIIVGSSGSPLQLTMSQAYYRNMPEKALEYRYYNDILFHKPGAVVPLNTRFSAGGYRIAGTSMEYLSILSLKMEAGECFQLLGDAVIGHEVAEKLNLKVGDHLISDAHDEYDVSGTPPLMLNITGVLKPSNRFDDRAIFTDIKTVWILEGKCHGHDRGKETHEHTDPSTRYFTRITEDNIDGFHFHGDMESFPLTSIIIAPFSQREADLILGEIDKVPELMSFRPAKLVRETLDVFFEVKYFFDLYSFGIIISMSLALILIMLLSIQIREKELKTLVMIGCSRSGVFRLIGYQIIILSTLASVLAMAVSRIIVWYIKMKVGLS